MPPLDAPPRPAAPAGRDAAAPVNAGGSGRRPLRVAALLDTAIVSGPGRQLAALAGALRAHDVELGVFMFQRAGRPTSPYVAYLEAQGITPTVIPERGPLDPGAPAGLRTALARWRPDVVQTHNYRTTVFAWLLRLTGARWPWVGFFHGATHEDAKVALYHRIDRALLPRADRVVVMSEVERHRFAAAGDRVQVIHNAVLSLPVVDETPALDALAGRPGPLVGVVGRLSPEKGVDVLLRAVRLLADRGTPVRLAVAGDGPERAALEALAAELAIGDRVAFLGPVRAVDALYAAVDLVVLPSRSEGLPNVLLEALRADRPVVATRVGAVPEVIGGEPAAGAIVAPDDVAALADAIVATLAAGGSEAAAAARRRVVHAFSLERRVAAHLALYDAVLPASAAGRGS